MSDISNIYSKVGAYESAYQNTQKPSKAGASNSTKKAESNDKANSKSNISGKTVGNPTLSDKAGEYYKELKKKYHNMEFILVSDDQKENAKKNAASYASHGKTVVLIGESEVEKMATDENFRKKYEGLIDQAEATFKAFAEKASGMGANVAGYGVQVNDDGTMSYFAVLKKSSEAQSERIAKKQAEAKAQKKADNKKAEKEKQAKRLEESRESHKADSSDKVKGFKNDDSEKVTLTADSFDSLLQKIGDFVQAERSDNVITEAEKNVGQNIDFSL